MTNSIYLILYSYRNKEAIAMLEQIWSTASNNVTVKFIDQYPLNRESKAKDLADKYDGAFVDYQHVFWDTIYSPIHQKQQALFNMPEGFEYVAIVSDDVIFNPGWDKKVIDFVNRSPKSLVSGKGQVHLGAGKYMFEASYSSSNDFMLSQYVSRNFLFGHGSDIRGLHLPTDLKYFGEEESLTFEALGQGLSIYSAPFNLYIDSQLRTMENIYCAFSIKHNYNSVVDIMQSDDPIPGVPEFFAYHKLDRFAIKKLTYPVDDVLYDPHQLKFNELGGERFIGVAKAIY